MIQPSFQATYSCDSTAPCGCSANFATVSRIVGGENATDSTWGWAVSLSIDDHWMCGGSLISNSWVLTAAHCIYGNENSSIFVSAATNQLYGAQQWRFASLAIVHPEYNEDIIANDVALIKVYPPFNMTDSHISLLCLPAATTSDYPPPGSTVVAIGWGKLSETGDVSDILQQVSLKRISYGSSSCMPMISNKTVQICAGVTGGTKDTCNGDSGGPLMYFTESKQWVVVGITSYGYRCANPYYAGVYTRVTYFRNWILSMTENAALSANVLTSTTAATVTSYRNMNITGSTPMMRTQSFRNRASSCQSVHLLFIIVSMTFFVKSFIM